MFKTQQHPFAFTRSPILSGLALLLPVAGVAAEDPLGRAKAVLARHPIVDGHNDLAWAIRENAAAPRDVVAYDLRRPTAGNTDIARLRRGGVGGQFWSVYVPADLQGQSAVTATLEQIDIVHRMMRKYPEAFE